MNALCRLLTSALLALFVTVVQLEAQEGAIAGRVTDMETGEPLESAAVEVLGSAAASSATDATGEFRLSVPAGTHSLLVTLIGHESSRTDGVSVEPGGTTSVAIRLRSRALVLNQLVVTVSRREEKELDAPASVSTLTNQQISRIIARTPADHVKTLPGVDLASTGLTQSYAVVRGFNNVASGRLLSIVDNRYARIPALRINAINMIPTTDMDIERIELARGPGAALYGPNAAEGVMHIITYSPIDRPGTTVSLGGGERSVVQFLLRSAHAVSDRFGFKVSGQYLRGKEHQPHLRRLLPDTRLAVPLRPGPAAEGASVRAVLSESDALRRQQLPAAQRRPHQRPVPHHGRATAARLRSRRPAELHLRDRLAAHRAPLPGHHLRTQRRRRHPDRGGRLPALRGRRRFPPSSPRPSTPSRPATRV